VRIAATKSPSLRRQGVSYAQLLVLIAIIALFTALLVPQVERLREQSNLIRCRDNLRKIGTLLLAYAASSGGDLPVSPSVENPHAELTAFGANADPGIFYCPSQRRLDLCYSAQNFHSGNIGYFYYGALSAGTDETLSKFLRTGVSWPRKLNTKMHSKTWVMSDAWFSAVPTSHNGYRKGVNYLMLDGGVDFVDSSPRQEFH
jgi:prepilin-type processing-associated H-X9-DG protein